VNEAAPTRRECRVFFIATPLHGGDNPRSGAISPVSGRRLTGKLSGSLFRFGLLHRPC
jgi:hypothetical protein